MSMSKKEFRKLPPTKGSKEEREDRRSLGLILVRGEEVISLTVEGPPPPDDSRLKTTSASDVAGPEIGCVAGRGVVTGPLSQAQPGLAGPVRSVAAGGYTTLSGATAWRVSTQAWNADATVVQVRWTTTCWICSSTSIWTEASNDATPSDDEGSTTSWWATKARDAGSATTWAVASQTWNAPSATTWWASSNVRST
ncbi:hypothetical protein ACS0TY_015568 [Phlomoides rotata]